MNPRGPKTPLGRSIRSKLFPECEDVIYPPHCDGTCNNAVKPMVGKTTGGN